MSEKRGFFKTIFGGVKPAESPPESADQPPAVDVDAAPDSALEPPVGENPPQKVSHPPTVITDDPPAAPPPVEKPAELPTEPPTPVAAPAPKQSWFQRLTGGLSRSSSALSGNIAALFTKGKLDDDTLQQLEDILIQADLGVETAISITESLAASRYDKEVTDEEVRQILGEEVKKVLTNVAHPLQLTAHKPQVILMVGVNGSGKTTTIGKLAQKFTAQGKTVMMAAGDTFRAAAIEQLKVWGERTGSPVVARESGADAASLAYDALVQAEEKNVDVLLIDTAGRLQNRTELMAELEKIIRVIKKKNPDAPHHTLLTLDATTGQHALQQVEIFAKVAGVTGLVMTKLDGTARGGILVAIAAKHAMPVHFIGVGEGADDLEAFTAPEFAAAISGHATLTPTETA
jgi:fused signal recognition particle receptor